MTNDNDNDNGSDLAEINASRTRHGRPPIASMADYKRVTDQEFQEFQTRRNRRMSITGIVIIVLLFLAMFL